MPRETGTQHRHPRFDYGELPIHRAMNEGLVKVDAAPVYLRHLGNWLRISSFTTGNPTPIDGR